jgi:probable rRNA maturation factor
MSRTRLRASRSGAGPEIEVQFAAARAGVPHPASLRSWAQSALAARHGPGAGSVTLRIVGAAEGRKLNHRWRGKDKATNVLSFPSGVDAAPGGEPAPLGDIVICAPVIRREAAEQGKSTRAHWAHMVVHGVLHLLGYDHESGREAAVMEGLERRLLVARGFPDPYGSEESIRR